MEDAVQHSEVLGLLMPTKDHLHQLHSASPDDKIYKLDRGTTTLAFKYQGGVVVACDSRASQGSFIASQSVRKIIEINDFMLGTMAGGAADCSFWERVLARECKVFELNNGRRISIKHAAKMLSDIFYSYRGYGLSAGTMITGYDAAQKEAELFFVDDSGSCIKGNLFSVGSGSTYAYGVLDTEYKFDMTDESAFELAKRAIFHAGHRDAASGGVVRVYHVNEKGWTKIIEAADFFDIYKEYYPRAN